MRELVEAELAKGVSQLELARRMNVSQATIHKILYTETKNTVDILFKIAKYFHVPVASLLDPAQSGQVPETTAHPICREIADICDTLDDDDKAED